MEETNGSTPNEDFAARAESAVPSLDEIASKMAAMRNPTANTEPTATGVEETPVAPDTIDDDVDSDEPKVAELETESVADTEEDLDPTEEVVSEDTEAEETADTESDDTEPSEIIDFLEFADDNPNAKFRFMRNGKEMVIDAKKAAAILGQGGAIHEEARELKIQRAEFDEYVQTKQAETEGLYLAMAFTVEPQIQKSYDEIVKTQGYQSQFRQQLSQTQDAGQQAKIRAAIQQNDQYIEAQQQKIAELQPNVDEFKKIRSNQVQEVLKTNRKNFEDRELRNEYVFNEIRDKISKNWTGANNQLVPGVPNIDLVSSDEHILSLLRDGLRYREKPRQKAAGSSVAAVANRKGSGVKDTGSEEKTLNDLRAKAKRGDKKAADNVLMAQLTKLRQARTSK